MKLAVETKARWQKRKEAQAVKRLVDEINRAEDHHKKDAKLSIEVAIGILFLLALMLFLFSAGQAHAQIIQPAKLKASWYSAESLRKEGTWKNGKEQKMANGKAFDETKLTCATRLYPLGTRVRVLNVANGRSVTVTVTDRIGKRFAKTRIDLSKKAFEQIASLKQGLVAVEVYQ